MSSPVLDISRRAEPRRWWNGAGWVALYATIMPIGGSVLIVSLGAWIAGKLSGMGASGAVYFAIGTAVLGGLAFVPTYSTALIAGWTFGFTAGLLAAVSGTVGGAVLCHLLSRLVARDRVAHVYHDHPRWELVRRALVEESRLKTLWIIFLLRLSPVLPFGTTNVLLATGGVKIGIYTVGTLLGLVPRIALIAVAAAGAEKLDFDRPAHWWIVASGLAATAACVAALALIGKHALERATAPSAPAGPPEP